MLEKLRLYTERVPLGKIRIEQLFRIAKQEYPDCTLFASDPAHWQGRFTILALWPYLDFKYHFPQISIEYKDKKKAKVYTSEKPLEELQILLKLLYNGRVWEAYSAGCLGFVSYDYARLLYGKKLGFLPYIKNFPDVFFRFHSVHIVFDSECGEGTLYVSGIGLSRREAKEDTGKMRKMAMRVLLNGKDYKKDSGSMVSSEIKMLLSKKEYVRKVQKIMEYIKLGHIYQANFSQSFESELRVQPAVLFERMFHVNPVPFSALLHWGGGDILSLSPECFLIRKGTNITTYPIKGTSPRGTNSDEDKRMVSRLLSSSKDEAELSMIVDLERNDLGRICVGGSINVKRHRSVDTFATLHHTYSVIEGTLRPGVNIDEIFRATFPGGSITGAPKVRCMQIIAELEREGRGIYTGCIGFIDPSGDFVFNIAIRTMSVNNGKIHFRTGGGIVYDSKSGDEYEESLQKAKAFLLALEQ